MIARLVFGRKRKDRWWRYHVLRVAFVEAQASAGEGQSLSRAFWRLGYGRAPTELTLFWCDLVGLGASRRSSLQSDDLQNLEKKAEGLPYSLVSGMCWLDLFRLCIGIGFFQLARILRNKGLDRVRTDGAARGATLEQVTVACYADVEAEDFAGARARLGRMEALGCLGGRLVQADWFITLMASPSDSIGRGMDKPLPEKDHDFGTLVHGQRIALVGPAPSKVSQGAEIDEHDVIVKFGYRGGDKGRDPDIQGARLDVSYYNNSQAKLLAESNYHEVLSSIRWAVFNNRKGRSHFPEDYPGIRLVASLQWLLPDTHLNAGPNALLDLLRFGPSGIKVFNTDMMLSSGRFAGYVPDGAGAIDHTRAFIKTHDPILQYQLMRRLWVCGHIAGDVRFEEVMEMGLDGYLKELQKAYGADTRALV
jgi:hypothetical protein